MGYSGIFPGPMRETRRERRLRSSVYSIQAISLRQAAVTADILGRTNASYRFTVTGAAAIGALIGGALGGLIGLRATMVADALGTLAAMCFVIRSPIPKLLDLSELEPDSASAKTGPATCDEAAAPDDITPKADQSWTDQSESLIRQGDMMKPQLVSSAATRV